MSRYTERELASALACEAFLRLTNQKGRYKLSLNQAASSVGKSSSFFSGENSMLARYLREGIDAFHIKRKSKNKLKVTEIAFSCYAVTDMARARKFYEDVLGLKPTTVHDSEHGKWVEYEFGPYALAIGSSPMFKPSPDGCSVALEVENFDDAVAQLKKHNVKFRIEPMATPVCSMTMVYDPDGNCICIHKRKAK